MRTERRTMGTLAAAAASAEATDGTTESGPSTSRQWHLMDSAHRCAVAGLTGTLWEMADSRQPLLPLARSGHLGSSLGTVTERGG